MEDEKITVYSYAKVWKIEKKVYSLMNYILPAPINPYEMVSFFGVMILIVFMAQIIPFLEKLPFVIRGIALPYAVTRYFMRKKLDGKNPIFYMIGILQYCFTMKGTYIEGWAKYSEKEYTVKCRWFCGKSKRRIKSEPVSN